MKKGCFQLAGAAALAIAVFGCGTPSVVRTALEGDLQSLKQRIADSQRRGELDRDTVQDLARAVAGREVRSSRGNEAVERVRSVRPCATPLVYVLRDRTKKLDDAGAEAAIVLYELGKLDREELVARYAETSSGAWRAVAARASIQQKNGALRRKLIEDPDERVRRAALYAALDAHDAADLDTLLEAARLDPDSLSRSLATRAVGAIGGERAVLGLDDRWARADPTTRITIVDAWAMPASWAAGGERKLIWVAESTRGLPSVAAADSIVRKGGSSANLGRALLARAIAEGTEPERRLAIQLAPTSDPDVKKAIDKASKSDDRQVRVMALARLVDEPKAHDVSIRALRELARGKDQVAVQARAALAAAQDASVTSGLTEQLKAPSSEHRRLAAVSLLRLGDYSRAAAGLADDDPEVRTAVACTVLGEPGTLPD